MVVVADTSFFGAMALRSLRCASPSDHPGVTATVQWRFKLCAVQGGVAVGSEEIEWNSEKTSKMLSANDLEKDHEHKIIIES